MHRAFCKIKFLGTSNFRWPFLDLYHQKRFSTRNFPILNQKFSHSPPKIFRWPSHLLQKFLSIQAILKRISIRNFPMTFLVLIYQKKISPHQILVGTVLVSGMFLYILTVSLENCPLGPGTPWSFTWYANTNIQNIHSSCSFPGTPYRRVPSQKVPECAIKDYMIAFTPITTSIIIIVITIGIIGLITIIFTIIFTCIVK